MCRNRQITLANFRLAAQRLELLFIPVKVPKANSDALLSVTRYRKSKLLTLDVNERLGCNGTVLVPRIQTYMPLSISLALTILNALLSILI